MELTSAGFASTCFSCAAFAFEPNFASRAAAAERRTPLLGMDTAFVMVLRARDGALIMESFYLISKIV
jgi:hypothetical protein